MDGSRREVILYTLSCPISGETKYIGKTTYSLRKRLMGHIYDSSRRFKNKNYKWIQSLVKQGLQPDIEILDIVLETEWEYWECFYISLFKTWGFELTNTCTGGEFIGRTKGKLVAA